MRVVGEGPIDLVLVPGFVSHREIVWEEPNLAHFLTSQKKRLGDRSVSRQAHHQLPVRFSAE